MAKESGLAFGAGFGYGMGSSRHMYSIQQLGSVVWITLAFAGAVFALDVMAPLLVCEWVLYLLPMIFACRTEHRRYPILFAIICAELTVLAPLYRQTELDWRSEFSNRALGVFVLGLTTALLYFHQRALEAVREREKFFRLISDSMSDMVAVIDEHGVRCYNSPSYEKVLGDPAKLIGTDSFGEIHPDDRERIRQIFEKTLKTGNGQRAQYRFLLNDGRLRYIESQGNLMQSGGGRRVVVVSRDVTDRVNLEAQFRQAQKMEAIGQLSGGVAHDFNNLITILHGYAQQLLSKTSLDADSRKLVQQMDGVAERAAHLTRQLLTFSRTQTAEFRLLDANDIIANVSKMLERFLGETVKLTVEPGTNIPRISADLGMVEQVLMNLSINARDAMPKGGRLIIRTQVQDVDTGFVARKPGAALGLHVVLEVEDTGCGMDEATLARIFEPFFTTKAPGKGTGLGLATVYGIMQKHRGWIDVTSQPGKGTKFRLFFPAGEAVNAPAEAESTPPDTEPARPVAGSETILLVEDEPLLRDLVQLMVEEYGYKSLPAGNAREALELWRHHSREVDLLLTDVVLPDGMSGRELAERLQQERGSLKVIFTSGYSADVLRKDIPGLLDSQFIQKPYHGAALGRVLRQALDDPGALDGKPVEAFGRREAAVT